MEAGEKKHGMLEMLWPELDNKSWAQGSHAIVIQVIAL